MTPVFVIFPVLKLKPINYLNHFKKKYFQGLAPQQLIPQLADLYCELNVIHPFREGNGCTQRIFFEYLIAHCGYGIDWSLIDSQQQWIQANIEGFYGNLNPLIQIFEICFIQNT